MSSSGPTALPAPLPAPIPVAGTDVHPVALSEAAEHVLAWSGGREPSLVVTPNVDHLVTLQRDEQFRRAYAASRLRVVDGMPVLALLRAAGRPVPGRVNGTDLFELVCQGAATRGRTVFLAGGLPDVLDAALRALPVTFPGLRVEGHSPPFGFEGTAADTVLQEHIARADPDIVMVCFGAPRSEKWATGQLARRPGVYLCVGSAVDFAAGARRRAPLWMQRAGLEWLHRLVQEPGRLWRRYLVQDAPFLLIALRELWRSRRRSRG